MDDGLFALTARSWKEIACTVIESF